MGKWIRQLETWDVQKKHRDGTGICFSVSPPELLFDVRRENELRSPQRVGTLIQHAHAHKPVRRFLVQGCVGGVTAFQPGPMTPLVVPDAVIPCIPKTADWDETEDEVVGRRSGIRGPCQSVEAPFVGCRAL